MDVVVVGGVNVLEDAAAREVDLRQAQVDGGRLGDVHDLSVPVQGEHEPVEGLRAQFDGRQLSG